MCPVSTSRGSSTIQPSTSNGRSGPPAIRTRYRSTTARFMRSKEKNSYRSSAWSEVLSRDAIGACAQASNPLRYMKRQSGVIWVDAINELAHHAPIPPPSDYSSCIYWGHVEHSGPTVVPAGRRGPSTSDFSCPYQPFLRVGTRNRCEAGATVNHPGFDSNPATH